MGVAITGCSQTTKTMDTSIKDIYKTVKFKDQAIEYRANIEVGACSFELLINDVPVQSYFGNANGTFNTSAPINNAILKSGIQKWKLVLYPAYLNGLQTAALSPNVLLDIEIESLHSTANGKGVRQVYDPISLIKTPTLSTDSGAVYAGSGKPMAVYEGTFEAKVPYQLIGWSDSKNLSEEKEEDLLKEVLSITEKYQNVFREKNTIELEKMVYNKELETQQANFDDKEGSLENWNTYLAAINLSNPEIIPIENYRIRIYGDGKIVSLERTDFPNIGEPVVRMRYIKDGRRKIKAMYALFHKPKGAKELEIIR